MIKDYYSLTKSGLIYGNLIPVIGGFALGATTIARMGVRDGLDFTKLLATLVGISLVMASGCVFNNYIDRDIDALMPRTKDRALVTGKISARAAIIFAIALGIIGIAVLAIFTNLLTVLVAAFGFFAYVFLYTLWGKRRTAHGALIGTISGATPPVIGYVAASGRLDVAAIILFVIMVAWQMPHFYAIAIRRADDYASAKIPVMPLEKGIRTTKIQMVLYVVAFILASSLLTVFGYAGFGYLAVALFLGLVWLGFCIKGFSIGNEAKDQVANKLWARKVFFCSLIVLVALFATITFSSVIA